MSRAYFLHLQYLGDDLGNDAAEFFSEILRDPYPVTPTSMAITEFGCLKVSFSILVHFANP
jgi:hypothetical protein